MRDREADGPANDQHEDDVYRDLEFSHSENVLVHDQNGRLDEAKSDDRDHVESEFGLRETSGKGQGPFCADSLVQRI